MVDALLEILNKYGFPVYRQGSLGKNEPYPEKFFTFWVVDSPEHAHYDNDNYGIAWFIRIYFYSTDPNLTYAQIAETRAALKAAGWVVPSAGYDVPSDEKTHTGRAIDVYYLDV